MAGDAHDKEASLLMDSLSYRATIDPFLSRSAAWLDAHVFTAAFLIQAVLILGLAAVSYFGQRALRPLIRPRVAGWDLVAGFGRFVDTAINLIGIALFLVLLKLASEVLNQAFADVGSDLLSVVTDLALAWGLIRLSSSVFANRLTARIIAGLAWFTALLSILGFLNPTLRALDSFGVNLGTGRISLLTVIDGALLLVVLLWASFFAVEVLDGRVLAHTAATQRTRVLVSKILKFVLITLAVVVTLSSVGINLSALAVFTGAVGVGVGIGLQHQVSNLVSGLFLLLDKSVKPGDVIEVNDTYGWVREMSARYVGVVTRDNKEILVPNDTFVLNQVVNWSHSDRNLRLEVKFGTSYDADPHLVRRCAVAAAKGPARISKQPDPVCHIVEFGDSSVNFVLRFWINDPENGVTNIKGEVLLALWDAFKAENIGIPYPHRYVILAGGPGDHPPRDR